MTAVRFRLSDEPWEDQRAAGRYHPARRAELDRADHVLYLTLDAGRGDDVHIYEDGPALYVLSINDRHDYCGLAVYDAETGAQTDRGPFLQADHEIRDTLGPRGLALAPRTIARRLMEYLS